MRNKIEVEVSVGELLDKISILEIKLERIQDEDKLKNIEKELRCLMQVREENLTLNTECEDILFQLKRTNERLWEIEDLIRECEREKNFTQTFIDLARSVYKQNDQRALLKRLLNEKLGSELVEEKSYAEYTLS